MSDLETTEFKLRTTPTGGLSGEHSPYYRRLLSAGYKGFMQGTLGGAGFYGVLGLAVGTLIAIPAFFLVPGLGAAALLLIPTATGIGVVKGANTFGNIGSVAAISAESADLTEQRRYLLDRYYDLPEGPEGDKQAEIIREELSQQNHPEKPHNLFHWKTVLICAAIGITVALGFTALAGFAPGMFGSLPVVEAIETFKDVIIHALMPTLGDIAATAVASSALPVIGGSFGALAGATIGLDRQYVRKWFDGTEKLLYDNSHQRDAMLARSQQVERLKNAAKADEQTRLILERRNELHLDQTPESFAPQPPQPPAPLDPVKHPLASLDQAEAAKPATKVSAATLHHRLAELQTALNGSTL